ncbi:DotU family type IV/VI secretion system protein [Burkholderia glumae]|uniref:DotU family type IV/VI secretion system protein n=1 Tax=Burkholderia glumae TaxID=337 RepID=A0AAQ0BRW6_BURGL|nr:DotU family type IV/VI secretion system protein [Burkholderia glumae]ACR31501.1 type IV / VI secretion system protein, DotU family [Burkholderia glumae BGR1]AJY64193.1 type IV/VI secretion system, DotU family domain protein [Burkholderia glumae LMG 2196 = ATCC 33617]KHJ60653.1 type IV secretion protein DotU [Burkholderia glumae]MCM2485338.1 DotU family type IV/VI secretion system protein [Burkholderia glumae]MCM2495691.1 DotU family type IV/VI secretion system protein [Burkholderia glumae]
MNTLTPDHNDVTPMDDLPGSSRVSGAGMRDLLRDTGLLVTTLAPGGRVQDAAGLRERCRQLITNFSDALARRGYPDDVRQDALIAQCGLLDETALRYLPAESRAAWQLKPLQVEQFNLHDAGERVIERLEARMREASPNLDLLECYSAILGMGFVGRYAREGEAKRTALVTSLNTQLETLRPSSARPFMTDRAGRRLSDWFYWLSPWAIAGLACVVALIVWMVWAAALDVQIAHLLPVKGGQP